MEKKKQSSNSKKKNITLKREVKQWSSSPKNDQGFGGLSEAELKKVS